MPFSAADMIRSETGWIDAWIGARLHKAHLLDILTSFPEACQDHT